MRRGAAVSNRSPSMTLEQDLEGGTNISAGYAQYPTNASQLEVSSDVSGKSKGGPRSSYSYSSGNSLHNFATSQNPNTLRMAALVLLVGTAVLYPFLPIKWSVLLLVYSSCAFGAIASLWLSRVVLECDDGTAEMRAIADPIREGASGFLKVQYNVSAFLRPSCRTKQSTTIDSFGIITHSLINTGYRSIRSPPFHYDRPIVPIPTKRGRAIRSRHARKHHVGCCRGVRFCFW